MYLLFQSFIFIDAEGSPVQELAAIEVNCDSHAIMDVFHGYARTQEKDIFARNHIHGLNQDYVKLFGYDCERSLITACKAWLRLKSYIALFANGARREAEMLDLAVCELNLAPWAERQHCASHKIAIRYKELSIPICKRRCDTYAHSSFVSPPPSSNVFTRLAKARHGHHCALYDCVELYYQHLLS